MRTAAALLALLLATPALAIDRDEVVDLARDYVHHQWYCSSSNLSVNCSNSWESDYSVGNQMGLPYDWGGYKSLAQFDSEIASGYGAGSHSWHGILSCTTGVDCSGFVSKLWDEGHYTTSSMSSISYGVNQSDLIRADALNKASSHIALFAHETNAGNPVIYESTSGGTRLYAGYSWSHYSSYSPIRYDNITNGVARGTVSNPIVIGGFPYDTFDSTAGAGSDQFDSYSCAPSTNESGPERVYRINVNQSGTLTATVTDDAGIDIDVHILGSADAGDCLDRDDVTATAQLSSGTYYLVLDTYVGSSEYPGGYSLHVEFTGGVGPGDDQDGDGYTVADGDCHDGDPATHPGAPETADHIDNDCDGLIDEGTEAYDDDGDGYTELDGDCDDNHVHTYPGAEEIGDHLDNDCDGQVDEGLDVTDDDGDGYSEADGDCADHDPAVHPGAPEIPDHIDNDCDGLVDEGTDYYDDDGDGYTEADGDCDDDHVWVYPGCPEAGDHIDNDCDGEIDEDLDVTDDDGDGYSEADGDCNDHRDDIYPGAPDIADGIDNDCDGVTDGSAGDDDDDSFGPNSVDDDEDELGVGCECRVAAGDRSLGGAALLLLAFGWLGARRFRSPAC